mmetsp:Transcript_90106/g.259788  ORF Transcript_90106/g.259788 Transcript_90106/m.259788 type:complete len:310 (-) Transcript_90106:4-933(-)
MQSFDNGLQGDVNFPAGEDQVHVNTQRHARLRNTIDQRRHEDNASSDHAQQHQHGLEAATGLRRLIQPKIALGWRSSAQGTDRGGDAEGGKASEADVEVHVTTKDRGVVDASDEVGHQDVCEHVRRGPLRDALNKDNRPTRTFALADFFVVAQDAAKAQQKELDDREHHREGDNKEATRRGPGLDKLLRKLEGVLLPLAHDLHAVHHGDLVAKECVEKARKKQHVTRDEHSQNPTSWPVLRCTLQPFPADERIRNQARDSRQNHERGDVDYIPVDHWSRGNVVVHTHGAKSNVRSRGAFSARDASRPTG